MNTPFNPSLKTLVLVLYLVGIAVFTQGSLRAQSLPAEIKTFAEQHNPGLQSKRSAQQALRYAYQAVGIWPAPSFEMALYTPEMEYPMGRQRYSMRAMQMLPQFKAFNLQRQDVLAQQQMAEAEYEVAKRSLYRSLQESWIRWRSSAFQLQQLEQSLAAMNEVQDWMRARNDAMASLEDQYDIELEILSMEIERDNLREQVQLHASNLYQEMGDTSRVVIIPIEPLTPITWMPDSLPAALLQHPELQMQGTLLTMETIQAEMLKVSGRPIFGIGVQYSRLNPIGSMMEGADMFMPMVQLNVPISFSKRNAALQSRRTMQDALEIGRDEIRLMLEGQWRQARLEYRQALRLVRLYQQQRELAYERYQLRLASYRVGRAGFEQLLESLRRYHDTAMREIMALEEQHLALNTLETLLGSLEPLTQD
jgi:outer membrane protein TolC